MSTTRKTAKVKKIEKTQSLVKEIAKAVTT